MFRGGSRRSWRFDRESRPVIRVQARRWRMLAELQRPDIGDDGPSIIGRDAVGIGIHGAVPFADTVIEMAVRCVAQARTVIARRCGKPRRAIMPSPSPARLWHGAQKISNRSRPRLRSSFVDGNGLAPDAPRRRRPVCRALRPLLLPASAPPE